APVAFCRARAAPADLARRLPPLSSNAQGLNADVEENQRDGQKTCSIRRARSARSTARLAERAHASGRGRRLMSLNSIMNIATSGMNAAQTQLRVVSDNVSNVNTPGYVRKIADQQSWASQGV